MFFFSSAYIRGKKAMSERRICLCALNRALGYEPAVEKKILEDPDWLSRLPERLSQEDLLWAEKELQAVDAAGDRFLSTDDEDYPEMLSECPDPPVGLYFRSCSTPAEVFGLRRAVAVVGTRDLSPYGREWCERLVRAMAETRNPPLIVSGLAYGADAVAHRTALKCGLPTVGVMATGIDAVYPWRHMDLAAEMRNTPFCALVTDYPRGTQPVALNFMRRNRIIAGLSCATIVIESKKKGGSLITAKYANDYNRDVYALPGRADDPRSMGCNSLIHAHMAEIITEPEDLAARLGLSLVRKGRKAELKEYLEREYGPGDDRTVFAMLVKGQRDIDCREICSQLGWSWEKTLAVAGMLEIDGIIARDLCGRCRIQKIM